MPLLWYSFLRVFSLSSLFFELYNLRNKPKPTKPKLYTPQYTRILGDEFLNTLDHCEMDRSRIIFQQDNDPKHKARLTVSLLENQCPAILDWPSYSPDLNPIENLWSILKKRVEQKVNKRISKKKPVTQVIFMDIIREEWGNIDQNLCLKLANSMKKRIELVIKRNGSII